MRNIAKTITATIIYAKKLVEFCALRAQNKKFNYIVIHNFSSVYFSQNVRIFFP